MPSGSAVARPCGLHVLVPWTFCLRKPANENSTKEEAETGRSTDRGRVQVEAQIVRSKLSERAGHQ